MPQDEDGERLSTSYCPTYNLNSKALHKWGARLPILYPVGSMHSTSAFSKAFPQVTGGVLSCIHPAPVKPAYTPVGVPLSNVFRGPVPCSYLAGTVPGDQIGIVFVPKERQEETQQQPRRPKLVRAKMAVSTKMGNPSEITHSGRLTRRSHEEECGWDGEASSLSF